METNIKFIKFFSIASGITFIICYITSVITFEEPWLNNNFLFSIFSGIFASFIVVLITEIKKYFDNKNIAENYIYNNCVVLYTELSLQIKQMDMYLKNKEELLPENILDNRMPVILSHNSALSSIDYTLIKKSNVFFRRFKTFIQQDVFKISEYIIACNDLHLAMNQVKMNYVSERKSSCNPRTADDLVNLVLRKIKAQAEARAVALDSFLCTMSSCFPNRFEWEKDKTVIDAVSFDIQYLHKKLQELHE